MISYKKMKFTKGVRKYIRFEKARIRQEFFDFETRKREIQKLYEKFFKAVPKS